MPLNFGLDASGNGNNWIVNNISQVAGSTYDSMLDVPSGNGYADGGNGRGNYAVLNPLEYYLNSPTNGNLDAYSATNNSNQVSTFALPNSGKWYWEVTRTETDSTSVFSWMVGVVKTDTNKAVTTYSNANAYVYNSWDGSKYTAGSSSAYGASWRTNGDVIGCAWDADGQTLTFYKNNVSQATAFSSLNYANGYTMIVSRTGGATASTLVTNFGQRPFSYTPPTGFKALNTTNLPDPTVKNGAGYMAATLYTGTGASQTVSNAVNSISFQPDLVWIKSRSAATNNKLTDSVRGATKAVISNTSDTETTDTNGLTAFNSSGFTVGTDTVYNNSGATYVGWNWKGGGTAVTNNDGNRTASVSASTTAGFSVVTYTFSTSATNTVGHGLGVAPSMIIMKNRTQAYNWDVYHVSVGYTQRLILNSTSAATSGYWAAAPTSTVFSTTTSAALNNDNMVAYCFAEVAGYSKFGSYTGNGSSDGPFVFTNFRPRFVLAKASSGAENWVVLDAATGAYNVISNTLLPNTSGAEVTGTARVDFLSNGFKLKATGGASPNGSGVTYVYAAFAENPTKYSNAR